MGVKIQDGDFFKTTKTATANVNKVTSSLKPWWQSQFIIFSFTHPRIRSQLEKLMGTNVVPMTDKSFMIVLQERMREAHEESVKKRIRDREAQEVEREKRLILEGKMGLEEAPAELAVHPVFKIAQLTKIILEERRLKDEAQRVCRKIKPFNYNLLKNLISETDTDDQSEIEVALALQQSQIEKKQKLLEVEDNVNEGVLFTEEERDRIKYEDSLMKDLRIIQTVDDMYTIADKLVGPITNRCIAAEGKALR